MALTYTPIATATGTGSATTITFSSIPSTYTDLVLIINGSGASGSYNATLQFNGDTGSNYSFTYLVGNGSIVQIGRNTNYPYVVAGYMPSGTVSTTIVNINNYSNTTTYKTTLSRENTANSETGAWVNLWRNTAAINSIAVINSGNWSSTTTATLYGIKSA
jgi:hypothetical protein